MMLLLLWQPPEPQWNSWCVSSVSLLGLSLKSVKDKTTPIKTSSFHVLSSSLFPAKSWKSYFLLARKTVLPTSYIVPKSDNYGINFIFGFWLLVFKDKLLNLKILSLSNSPTITIKSALASLFSLLSISTAYFRIQSQEFDFLFWAVKAHPSKSVPLEAIAATQ